LGATDTLKFTFQVADETTDKGIQPHQTFLRFFDSTTGEEGIQPVKVLPSGKAKFELVCLFSPIFSISTNS
jgi:oligosaccharyltransferase complex subunit delta (ribophorin II)